MFFNDPRRDWLVPLIVVVAGCAALWNSSMLVGGIRASGQLDSEWNPLGSGVAFVAAFAINVGTALFFYVLSNRRQTPRRLLVLASVIVGLLMGLSTLTQTFMVVDGASGENFEKGTEAKVSTAWRQAEGIDRAMVDTYKAQLGHYAARMEEERPSGEGPRFWAAEQAYNRLREEYGSALARTENFAQGKRSITDDVGGVQGYVDALHSKAAVFDRFAGDVGITAPDFATRLDGVEGSLDGLSAGEWIDRRGLVYDKVIDKLGEMLGSGGTADLGFTLSVLMAFTPDLIQILCTCLLIFLFVRKDRSDDGDDPGANGPDDPGDPNDQNDPGDWTPGDRVWGESVPLRLH